MPGRGGRDASGKVNHHVFVQAAEVMALIDSASVSINGAVPAPPPPIPIDKALTDARVAMALAYLARDESWVELYKVFEVVRGDAGDEQTIVARGWATNKACQTCRHAVDLSSMDFPPFYPRTHLPGPPRRDQEHADWVRNAPRDGRAMVRRVGDRSRGARAAEGLGLLDGRRNLDRRRGRGKASGLVTGPASCHDLSNPGPRIV
jgi:hypothetical protein